MSTLSGGPNVVMDGLVLWLDAANTKSYVSGSTTWGDLSRGSSPNTILTQTTYSPTNNGSILFQGSSSTSYGTLPHSNTYAPTGSNSSMEIWVKFNYLDYTTNSGSLMWFFRKDNPDTLTPNKGVYFSYDNRVNRSSFGYTCFGNTAGGFGGGGNNFNGSQYNQIFQTGSWNHIVFTINNSTGSFYINGIQKGASKIFSNLDLYSTQNSLYGITSNNAVLPSTPFNIALFKIYNRALTAQEVLQNYNATKSRFNLT
jgi:hypothetical protein